MCIDKKKVTRRFRKGQKINSQREKVATLRSHSDPNTPFFLKVHLYIYIYASPPQDLFLMLFWRRTWSSSVVPYRRISINGGYFQNGMVYKVKSQSKMDDVGQPPFLDTSIYMILSHGYHRWSWKFQTTKIGCPSTWFSQQNVIKIDIDWAIRHLLIYWVWLDL